VVKGVSWENDTTNSTHRTRNSGAERGGRLAYWVLPGDSERWGKAKAKRTFQPNRVEVLVSFEAVAHKSGGGSLSTLKEDSKREGCPEGGISLKKNTGDLLTKSPGG